MAFLATNSLRILIFADTTPFLHPAQVGVINEIFDVTPEETSWAEKVLAELEDAEQNKGRALSTLEGHLIDDPHRSAAERILRRARLSRKQRSL
jgi:citrate lyase beta subunit